MTYWDGSIISDLNLAGAAYGILYFSPMFGAEFFTHLTFPYVSLLN
jgi:hypothetical protein